MTTAARKFGISQSVRRVEDKRLLTGAGAYVDDQRWDGQVHAYFLRSSVAHADIKSIDVNAARTAPGVVGVFTGADFDASSANKVDAIAGRLADGTRGPCPVRPVLATDRVRYVGEAVAMIVAETLMQAKDAAERIDIDYRERPVVIDLAEALKDGAPQLHAEAPGNLALDEGYGDKSAADAAMAGAAHCVKLELINNRVVSNPMETRGALARWDESKQKLITETGTQGVWGLKAEIAARLGLHAAQVQVVTKDVGGGFGTKSYNYPEQIAVAYAAKALNRPIKWVADRSESFLSDAMGRDHVTVAEAGFDDDYRLVALRVETLAALGAQLSPVATYIPGSAAYRVLTGVYDLQAAHYAVKGVFTNTTPVDAYRGAGRPETIYMLERLMDYAARKHAVDPVTLRRKNFIRPDQMPYQTAVGEMYDSGDFDRVMTAALAKADWRGFAARREASAADGKLRGLGLCCYIESILGSHNETTRITLTKDGEALVYTGIQSNGQGHETALAQILAEKSGIEFDKIRIIQGDSDLIAQGGGTGGSRSVTMQGVSINGTVDTLIEQLKPLAEETLEVSAADLEFVAGAFCVVGADRRVDLMSLSALAHESGSADLATAEKETVVPGRSYPNGCHIAEVVVDPETGAISVERYVMVDDFGLLINPLLAEGQAQGGVVQGLGQALSEFVAYDADGQLQNGSFMDYAMPRADDSPWLEFYTALTPSTANPIGMKGCGEAGTVGALAAITNAVFDAVWEKGVEHVDMPLTPQRVWSWLNAARQKEAV
jgi:carbon-monoxide dehydrogenase large subunit